MLTNYAHKTKVLPPAARLVFGARLSAMAAFWLCTGIAFGPPLSTPAADTNLSNATAAGGWSSLGAMSVPTWDGKTLTFHSDQGVLAITPLSEEVIRVRFTRAKEFGRDHSYAVVNQELGNPNARVRIDARSAALETPKVTVSVQYDPLRISFYNSAGASLDADDPCRGISFAGSEIRVAKRLREDEHVYGLGEKTGRLDKRGWQQGGYNYVMWNSDTYQYDSSTDPLYVSVPFFMVVRGGQAHGIFLDNTGRSFFDIGRERPDLLTFGVAGGDLDYYFIHGPTPKQVVERYTALTGRMPLPPLWALGYNQCRYSYYPESKVLWLAETFRQKKIPADVIWLDIHYLDNYRPFTWDPRRFPTPQKMLSQLRAEHFRVVSIIDPHPEALKGYAPYDEGMAKGYFVKNPDGTVYQGPVWPSKAPEHPGPSVFPDFSNPAVRQWWGSLYQGLLSDGVAGIWNDMDEPSVFTSPTGTLPPEVRFDNDGQPTAEREIHNVYGQLMSRATFEGLSRLRPNERPFVLTRSSFAGGQRYAAVWTGDNTSDWSSLRQSLPMLMGMGLSGFPFVGSDIGGFVGAPSGELYTRWLQIGVFYPFMRSHSEFNSPSKEPWAFGYRYETLNRQAIALRYELLPYIYNTLQQASETGVPALRPLFLEFPNDEQATDMDDEFLFGADLLVAPVLQEGARERAVYLPAGNWYDYWTGRRFAGGKTIQVPVTLSSIPVWVREGGFIFRQPVVQSTDQMPGNALQVLVAPAGESASSLYEDDGRTLNYRKGDFMKRQFRQVREPHKITLTVSAPVGSFRPAPRELVLQVWCDHRPKAVTETVEGGHTTKPISLPPLRQANGKDSSSGWFFANGLLTVRTNDSFLPMQFTIEQ